MSKKSVFCRITVFGCILLAAVMGVAPNVLAVSVTAPDGGSAISQSVLNPGSALSGEEMAALSAQEAGSKDHAEIASGSALSLIGAVVVVYLVWVLLKRNW